jgi:hypothetical protein
MSIVQIKLLAAILGLLAMLGAAYLYQARQDHRPGYVLTEEDKTRSKKLLPKSPSRNYLEP